MERRHLLTALMLALGLVITFESVGPLGAAGLGVSLRTSSASRRVLKSSFCMTYPANRKVRGSA